MAGFVVGVLNANVLIGNCLWFYGKTRGCPPNAVCCKRVIVNVRPAKKERNCAAKRLKELTLNVRLFICTLTANVTTWQLL